MANTKTQPTYKTSDIHVAAALLAIGHRLISVERMHSPGSRQKAFFCFEETPELKEDVLNYMNDDLEVAPRPLFTRLRELKSMVHNL